MHKLFQKHRNSLDIFIYKKDDLLRLTGKTLERFIFKQLQPDLRPFAYLTQFAGGLVGIKFGVANFSYVVNRQVFKNGGIDFQNSPVGGALGTKPCFDFDVLKVSIPKMAIDDKVWSDTNKFKNARL